MDIATHSSQTMTSVLLLTINAAASIECGLHISRFILSFIGINKPEGYSFFMGCRITVFHLSEATFLASDRYISWCNLSIFMSFTYLFCFKYASISATGAGSTAHSKSFFVHTKANHKAGQHTEQCAKHAVVATGQ